jgi:spermidine synthase
MSHRKAATRPPARPRHLAGDAADPTIRATYRTELLVQGVVQSVDVERGDVPDYWHTMIPDAAPSRCLILGAGGGTVAALLLRRFPATRIVAVDHNPAVVALGRREFYLEHPSIDLLIADAFQFAASCPGRFDYIAVDLFDGASWPRQAASRPFLRDLRRLLGGRGLAVFNLFRDTRADLTAQRIARVLGPPTPHIVGDNLVLHFRFRS